jgi:HPt (histidine-containing phosphotransfer) domain-containing protein
MKTPNLNYIKSLSQGEESFEDKIIGIIKLEFQDELNTYNNNIAKKNYKRAAENVHKLKHKIGIFGMEEEYYLAEKFENNLSENNPSLKDEFQIIIQIILNYLTNL